MGTTVSTSWFSEKGPTCAEQLRSYTDPELPRSVKHCIERKNSFHIKPDQAGLMEYEVLAELRQVFLDRDQKLLEEIISGSNAEMKQLSDQLHKLAQLKARLERSYLYHWHRSRQADWLLAELAGKVTKISLAARSSVKKRDPEAEYLAKFNSASEDEKKRMLAELMKEVHRGS